jgi:high frequency lysogenization protein
MDKQVITLAAICQAAKAVQQVARKGQIDQDALALLLNSILNLSPANYLDVYGSDIANLKIGLQELIKHLDDTATAKDPELTRYVVSLMALERKLVKNKGKLSELGQRIEQIQRQLEHFELTSDTIVASMASIYSDIISPLGQRIQVAGDVSLLQQNSNQNKIRALLLAGIRAAVLWRQLGGKRRHILWRRRALVVQAKQILNQI